MPSTPSPRLRAELQARGENVNTWGDARLNNALLRLEEGIAKVLPLTVTGNLVLTAQNYSEDEARSAVLLLKGTPPAAFTVTIPNLEKTYWVVNDTAQVATLATVAGDPAQIRAGFISFVVCDGDDTRVADFPLDKLMPPSGPLSLNGKRIENLGPATADGHAVTRLQLMTLTQPLVDLARDWAQKLLGTVDGSEYSAKEYAIGATVPAGSAKKWAFEAYEDAQTASTAAVNASLDAQAAADLLADFSNRYVVSANFPTTGNFNGRLAFATTAQQFGVYKQSLGAFTVLDAPQQATDTAAGIVELSTNAETQTGTDAIRAVTPASLSSRTATETRTGLVELATVAEATAGTDTSRAVTAAGVAAHHAANPPNLSTYAQFTTSTNAALTDYPIGTVVGYNGSAARNATVNLYLNTNGDRFDTTSTGQPQLSGTWRHRGYGNPTGPNGIAQRVA